MAIITTTGEAEKLIFVKQLAGAEDLLLGIGSTAQIRNGENVSIEMINASNIPYDSTRSIKDVLDELLSTRSS